MKCPKCKHVQEGKVECESCGIVFGKYYKALIRKKFEFAYSEYLSGNSATALKAFNTIINAKLPKDSLMVERCHDFILKINNKLSESEQNFVSETPADKINIITQQPISEGQSIDKKLILEDCNPQHNIFSILINNKRILFGFLSGVISLIVFVVIITIYATKNKKVNNITPNENMIVSTKNEKDSISGSLDQIFKSAENGDSKAQYSVAKMYFLGEGVAQDKKKAVALFAKSAVQGDAEAQVLLGTIYSTGEDIAQDKTKAAELFTKSAEQGNAEGQYHLGVSYRNGEGVVKNKEKAVEWYTKAAEQGEPKAQFNLCVIFSEDLKNVKEWSNAKKWCTKAAEQGDPKLQYNLGLMFYKYEGGAFSSEAFDWFSRAASQGNEPAQKAANNMIEEQKQFKKDIDNLSKSPKDKEAECEKDCSVNKYQYSESCKFACMKAKKYW